MIPLVKENVRMNMSKRPHAIGPLIVDTCLHAPNYMLRDWWH